MRKYFALLLSAAICTPVFFLTGPFPSSSDEILDVTPGNSEKHFLGKSRYDHGDPGEEDGLDVSWMELRRSGKNVTWRKDQLSSSLVMGFGPVIADIDNDHDSDLITRGLSFGDLPQFDVIIFQKQPAAARTD